MTWVDFQPQFWGEGVGWENFKVFFVADVYAKDMYANNFCLQPDKLMVAQYHCLNDANHILGGLDP